MQITYCEQWSRHYSHPHLPLTEQQAAERHQKNKLYTALLGDPGRPRCFLEFSAYRSVCVEFLDASLRSLRDYSFQEKRPNELFLSGATIRQFSGDSPEPNWGDVYHFEVDGRLIVEHYEVTPRATTLISSEETTTDVGHNWEPYPEFGQYEGLAQLDRGIPLLNVTQADRGELR